MQDRVPEDVLRVVGGVNVKHVERHGPSMLVGKGLDELGPLPKAGQPLLGVVVDARAVDPGQMVLLAAIQAVRVGKDGIEHPLGRFAEPHAKL